MSIITILIFILAAVMGLFLITYILRNKNTPKGLAIIHGSVAALGIILVIILLFNDFPKLYISLVLFILAALGGFTMMYRDITGKSLPKWLALGHGLIAVIGFLCLLLSVFYLI